MKKLFIKQKLFSLKDKFTVMNEAQKDVYYIEGSFFKIPKTFVITDYNGHEVAQISKKVFSLLPRFIVDINGSDVLTIKKEFSLFKPKYIIEGSNIEIQGNWWEMDFTITTTAGKSIARIQQSWLSWGDFYEIQIFEEAYETLIIATVVAIDYVKEESDSGMINFSTPDI